MANQDDHPASSNTNPFTRNLIVEARYFDYMRRLHYRLQAGAKAYGDKSMDAPAAKTIDELKTETLDLAGWGYVLHTQLDAMKASLHISVKPTHAERRGNPGELKAFRELEQLLTEESAPSALALVEALKKVSQARLNDNAPDELPKPSPDVVIRLAEDLLAHQVLEELRRATAAFGPFNSGHEGHGVIAEELDELWDLVKEDKHGFGKKTHPEMKAAARKEAIQVAAMAMRFALDLCK